MSEYTHNDDVAEAEANTLMAQLGNLNTSGKEFCEAFSVACKPVSSFIFRLFKRKTR